MGEVKSIKTKRDDDGIRLSFVRKSKLVSHNLNSYTKFTGAEMENRLAAFAKVRNPVIQFSSLKALKNGEALRDSHLYHHSFLSTALAAWSQHRALVVSPDHFWLLILQAVAMHVNQNAEELRAGFVKHKGKATLTVRRDEFVLDSGSNDWAGVIEEMNDKIREKAVDDVMPLLQPEFSTTGAIDELASQLTLMNVMMSYHGFMALSLCGFPWVRMEGTAGDWEKLRQQAEDLLQSGKLKEDFAKRWSDVLIPILIRLEESAQGKPEVHFWDRMIKKGGFRESGGVRWLNGWVNVFLPLIKGDENPLCFAKGHGFLEGEEGTNVFKIPRGLCSTPITWKIRKKSFKLQAVAGFVGMIESNDGSLRPEVAVMLARSGKVSTTEKISKAIFG